jgi:hypothetical protein
MLNRAILAFNQALRGHPKNYCTQWDHQTTIDDLCFICQYELDLHTQGSLALPFAIRKSYVEFIDEFGTQDESYIANHSFGRNRVSIGIS